MAINADLTKHPFSSDKASIESQEELIFKMAAPGIDFIVVGEATKKLRRNVYAPLFENTSYSVLNFDFNSEELLLIFDTEKWELDGSFDTSRYGRYGCGKFSSVLNNDFSIRVLANHGPRFSNLGLPKEKHKSSGMVLSGTSSDELLVKYVKNVKSMDPSCPMVMLGDFNKNSKKLAGAFGGMVSAIGDKETTKAGNSIDHILYEPENCVPLYSQVVTQFGKFSHYPVVACLTCF